MLPPRLAKKPKRSSRWRSQKHLNFVRSHQCIVPGCTGMPIEAMHIRLGSHTGLGQKPDDWRACSGCKLHHATAHAKGEESFQVMYGVDFEELISAFIKGSPCIREIEAVMAERQR